jgi:hypothetical protein
MPYADFPTRREEIERRVVRRAWADPAYRDWLRDDPRAALEDELGISLPSRLHVTLVEERSDHLCIVLPVDLSAISERDSQAMTGLGRRAGEPPPPE